MKGLLNENLNQINHIEKYFGYFAIIPAITAYPVAPSPHEHEMPRIGGHKSHPASVDGHVRLVVEARHCVQVQVLNPAPESCVYNNNKQKTVFSTALSLKLDGVGPFDKRPPTV